MSYNGWTNRETWCAMLWLNNDESMYRAATTATTRTELRDIVGDNRAAVVDIVGDRPTGMARVDWDEILAAVLEDRGDDND